MGGFKVIYDQQHFSVAFLRDLGLEVVIMGYRVVSGNESLQAALHGSCFGVLYVARICTLMNE